MNRIKQLSKSLGNKARNFLTSPKGLCTASVLAPALGVAAGMGLSALTHGSINSAEFFASAASNVVPCGIGALLASFMGIGMLDSKENQQFATNY